MPYKDKEKRRLSNKLAMRRYYKKYPGLHSERNKTRKENRKRWFKEYKKSLACLICGESDIACLDFHHRDRTTREHCVGTMMGYSIKRILEEIEKCDVLCSNCHRKILFHERGKHRT